MVDAIVKTALDIILNTGGILIQFMRWFYLTFLPFVIQYIGIPLFVLGAILAVAFAGGTLIFIILFFIFMYFFIKGTIFDSKP
jgi:hypothetical protein